MAGTTTSRRSGISRRKALKGAAWGSAGIAATLAMACGGQEAPQAVSSTSASVQPKRGGTFIHTNAQETTENLDPQTSTPFKGMGLRLIYQGLLGYHPETYEVEPEIGQKWEQPSETEYVFTLQPGVKFHNKPPANGRLMTAADVVFSLNRARSPDPNFTSRSLLDNVDKIEAIDGSRIRTTAKRPEAPTLSKLSGDSFLIMAPEVVERANKFATPEEAVGTGAFMITGVLEKVGADYVRNPDYWKPGLPYLDGFQTKHFDGGPGNDRAWAAFLAGRLDAVVVPGTESKKYIEQQGANYSAKWYKDNGLLAVINPNTKVKPFDDPRVTKALKLLTDHEEFLTAWAATWFGQGRNVSMLPPSLDAWDLSHEEYYNYLEWKQPKDAAVKEALALLSAAGFTQSNQLKFEITSTISTNYSSSGAELTQAQFKRLGQGVIDTTLRTTEGAAYQAIRANRDYVFGSFTNLAGFNEPDVNLTQMCYTGASRNYWNYSDPKLDAMIDRQRVIFDIPQRKAAIREIMIYMIDTFPGVMGAGRLLLNATKPNVRDIAPEVWIDGRQYEKVWLDA